MPAFLIIEAEPHAFLGNEFDASSVSGGKSIGIPHIIFEVWHTNSHFLRLENFGLLHIIPTPLRFWEFSWCI